MKASYTTYKNAGMIQEHLDAQEHIWKTSGTILDKTGHHLQMWHHQHRLLQSMALLVLPDTHPTGDLYTKFQQHGGIPSQWAPTPKNLNSHN